MDGSIRNQLLIRGIESLWYLAHVDNLQSIFQLGILSYNEVERHGVAHSRIDWDSVQSRRQGWVKRAGNLLSVHDMVPLFFSTHQPMLYVQVAPERVAHLEVDPIVLTIDGACFSDGNIAASMTRIYFEQADLDKLDWRIIRTKNCWSTEYKRKKAAEVLVPSPLDSSCIRGIHVASEGVLTPFIRRLASTVKISLSPDLYRW